MRIVVPRMAFGVQQLGEFPRPDIAGVRVDLERQLQSLGSYIREVWTAVAQARQVRNTGAYLQGINENGRVTMEIKGDAVSFEGTIEVFNTAEHARIVEDGHSAFHLPKRINWAGHRRSAKTGKRYMYIAFNHSTTASDAKIADGGLTMSTIKRMMPQGIYNRAKRLGATRQMKVGPQYNADGSYKAKDATQWGGRLHEASGGASMRHDPKSNALYLAQRTAHAVPGSGVNPAWQTAKHDGMFRVGGGKGQGSRYFTIRTITEDSPGWHIPALAGKHVARDVEIYLRSGAGREALQRRMQEAVARHM